MFLHMLKCKVYGAVVTEARLDYEGSISIDPTIRDAAGLLINEKVMIVNNHNGERFETYVLPGKPRQICLNGAAARKALIGDELIIMAFCTMTPEEAETHVPVKIRVNPDNSLSPAKQ